MRRSLWLALAVGVLGAAVGCARDADDDGVLASVDCDDDDPGVGLGEPWYRDSDGDGFGDPARWLQACAAPDGYCSRAGDCADTDRATNPDALERWYDGWDQDCDGGDDYDQDDDGYSSAAYGGDDCDDRDPAAHPGAYDAPWDGVDADCSGGSDDDWDGDGYDADHAGGDDCDDLSADVHPGAVEGWYDGVDQDCDGASDFDQDGDGYDSREFGGGDCDDLDPEAWPGAAEFWYDGVDQDCDGASDFDQDGDGYDSQEYGGADCQDGDEAVHPGAFEWNDGDDNDCDGNNDVRYLGSAEWALAGEGTGDAAGSMVAAAGDVDGDGLQDLLVGAPAWQRERGAAYLLLGASALGASGAMDLWRADARVAGGSAGDGLGAALSGLGDTDGDGYADLLLAAPAAGVAYVLAGPLVGDLDVGDARAILGPLGAGLELGSAAAGGGDLNGDAALDLALGAPGAEEERGLVLLWAADSSGSLGEDDAFARLEGATSGDRAGASVAVVGDTDGDGLDDLLVGVPGHGGHGPGTGAAYLFRAPLAGTARVDLADVSMMGEAEGDAAGSVVAAAGDTDADGYADLLVGAPTSDKTTADGGAAFLVLGPVSASAMELTDADAIFSGDIAGILVGSALAGGDVDSDGYDDVLVGAPGADFAASDNGVGYLVLGPFAGSLCTCGSDAKLYGAGDDYRAGSSVALPGDVDGDGFGDLLRGAPGGGAGAAYLVLGAER